MAGIVLGMSNKRSIIGVFSLRKTARVRDRMRNNRRITSSRAGEIFFVRLQLEGTVKAVSRRRYKKSLLFPLDGSHSSLCTCLRTAAEFVRWNAYNNPRPPLLSFFFSFPCGFFNVRGWKLNSLAPSTINASLFNFKEREKKMLRVFEEETFLSLTEMKRIISTEERILVEARTKSSKLWFEYLDASNRLWNIFVKKIFNKKKKRKTHSYCTIYLTN